MMTEIRGFKGDIYQTGIVMRYELLKFLRSKRLYIFLGLLAAIMALLTIAPYAFGDGLPDDAQELASSYIQWMSMFIIIGVTLFSASSIVSEFEERTALLMFTRPIRKESMFAGKFLTSFLVTAVFVVLYYIITMIISLAVTGSIYGEIYASLGLAILFTLAGSGLAFLLGAFMKKGTTATVMTFLLLLMILPMISAVVMVAGTEPIIELTYASGAILAVITGAVTEPYTVEGITLTNYVPDAGVAAIVMFAWFVVTTVIAVLKFKSREF